MADTQRHGKYRKPYIILSNDDGIKSAGLKTVFNAVSGMADVLVAAPDRERSGAARSFSIWPAVISVMDIDYRGTRAYSVSGTPVDCAKLALYKLAKRKPDIFISGINHGPNTAQFIFYSGTIGAAAEAALLGIPAMAFSIDSYEPKQWAFAEKFISSMVKMVLSGKIKIRKHMLLNINIPQSKSGDIKGIKILQGGKLDYRESYVFIGKDGTGKRMYRHMTAGRTKRKGEITDSDGVENGFITITPLKFDLNDRESMKKLKDAGLKLP